MAKSCPIGPRLYRAALKADNAFTRALVKEYGSKRAADARYRYTHASASVNHAKKRKLKLDACLHQWFERERAKARRKG